MKYDTITMYLFIIWIFCTTCAVTFGSMVFAIPAFITGMILVGFLIKDNYPE